MIYLSLHPVYSRLGPGHDEWGTGCERMNTHYFLGLPCYTLSERIGNIALENQMYRK